MKSFSKAGTPKLMDRFSAICKCTTIYKIYALYLHYETNHSEMQCASSIAIKTRFFLKKGVTNTSLHGLANAVSGDINTAKRRQHSIIRDFIK